MTVTSSAKGPSGWWYAVAAGIAAASIITTAAIIGCSFMRFIDVFDLTYFQGPGTQEVYLHRGGKYVVYMEARPHAPEDRDGLASREEPQLSIQTMDTNALLPTEFSPEQMTVGGREMLGLRSFVAPSRGSYRIQSAFPQDVGPPSALFAIGPVIDHHQLARWFIWGPMVAMTVVILGMGSAIGIFIVTLVRRLRAGRTQTAAPAPPAPPTR